MELWGSKMTAARGGTSRKSKTKRWSRKVRDASILVRSVGSNEGKAHAQRPTRPFFVWVICRLPKSFFESNQNEASERSELKGRGGNEREVRESSLVQPVSTLLLRGIFQSESYVYESRL